MTDEDRTLLRESRDPTLFKLAEQGLQPCLILYSGPHAGRRFDLEPGRHLIGRSVEAALRLEMPGVSRRHAELEVEGEVVTLHDLGSANRTCVNEQPIEGPTVLKQGDLVRVDNAVLRFHDRQSLDAALHDRVYRLAITDAGTGVYNRMYLGDTLQREVQRARRGRHPLAAICFDLDHFKRVNDTHGHAAGDQVLRECAQRVKRGLRGGDVLCRSGGEEFTVLLPDTDLALGATLAERLRAAVDEAPFLLTIGSLAETATLSYAQTISLGVAELTPAMIDGQAMLELADQRLYAAKHAGRNRVVAQDTA